MTNAKPTPLAALRRKARHYAVQALYQWQMAGAALNAIEAEFRVDYDMSKVDVAYFHELLHQIPAQLSELDAAIEPLLDRPKDEVGPVELAVLRMGTYELKNRIDVPFKVAINESVSLAKKFGPEDSHKFVNGILDQLAREFRAVELAAQAKT